MEISQKEHREMDINGSKTVIYGVEARHALMNEVLDAGSSTVTWVGRKHDGIHIGFKVAQMKSWRKWSKKSTESCQGKHSSK